MTMHHKTLNEMLRKTHSQNSGLYGYEIMWTHVHEYPEVLCFISRSRRTIYVNKDARENAVCVSLS